MPSPLFTPLTLRSIIPSLFCNRSKWLVVVFWSSAVELFAAEGASGELWWRGGATCVDVSFMLSLKFMSSTSPSMEKLPTLAGERDLWVCDISVIFCVGLLFSIEEKKSPSLLPMWATPFWLSLMYPPCPLWTFMFMLLLILLFCEYR